MRTSDNHLILINDSTRTDIVVRQQFELKYKIVHISSRVFKKIFFLTASVFFTSKY